jgi:hypothetical protein
MPRLKVVGVLILCLATRAIAAPSMKELQDKYRSGDYRGTLSGIAQALALRGAPAEAYDRYELLMLRGDCLVQLNSGSYAGDAFDDARESTEDIPKRAAAGASELVARKAPIGKYVPRTGPDRDPIDIKSPDSRKKAMDALRADLLAQNRTKIEAARNADNLEPMIATLPVLRQIAVLEMGSTGQLTDTKPVLQELGIRARGLIGRDLKGCRMEVAQINANSVEIENDRLERRGLFTQERKDLAALGDHVQQIESVGSEGRRIAEILSGDVAAWDKIVAEATDLATRIEVILRRAE